MPIIEPVPEDVPLSQGDILRGLKLFSTNNSDEDGGEPALANDKLCMCISRPCVAINKSHVTALPIEKMTGGTSEVKSLDDVRKFLKKIRDGEGAPDVFYLGEMPGYDGRFAARLDSFHDIEIPTKSVERAAFLSDRRIARLSDEFTRDLQVRIFSAFASFGFDDLRWYSDKDLGWVIDKGKAEIAAAESALHEVKAQKQQKEFTDKPLPDHVVANAEKKVTDLRDILAPFEAELQRRSHPA